MADADETHIVAVGGQLLEKLLYTHPLTANIRLCKEWRRVQHKYANIVLDDELSEDFKSDWFPTWRPTANHGSCVNVYTARETIRAGWYVDTENRKMRLDSYSIPQGFNASTVELYQYVLREVEDFEYACAEYGPPLHIFLYHYDKNRMLSLFPSSDAPYRSCSVSAIYNKFPNSPLLPDIEFVEEDRDNITSYDHWRSEFFLFTMDYLFHTSNGIPYKLIVNGEENIFVSFEEGKLTKNTFYPPPGVNCT